MGEGVGELRNAGVVCARGAADKEDVAAVGNQISQRLSCSLKKNKGLLQVYDMDAVPLREDIGLHSRLPTSRLMSKMDTGLKQGLHSDPFRYWGLLLNWRLCRCLYSYFWLQLGVRDCNLFRQRCATPRSNS